jgi:RNA polymerase sigma factor (TIGR02999 family)
MSEATESLLVRVRAGEPGALAELFEATYPRLCRMARAQLHATGWSGEPDCSAIVHEVYLRLAELPGLQLQHLHGFYAYAGRVMRSVIVDAARERASARRGGPYGTLALDEAGDEEPCAEDADPRVHDALLALEADAPRLARLVELRYFGGYSEHEIAQALQVSDRTLRRDWERARALLQDALR